MPTRLDQNLAASRPLQIGGIAVLVILVCLAGFTLFRAATRKEPPSTPATTPGYQQMGQIFRQNLEKMSKSAPSGGQGGQPAGTQ